MSLLEGFARVAAGRRERRPGFLASCFGRIAFIAFALVGLALYIKYNGPVM